MPMKRRRHFWGDPRRGPAAGRPLAPGPLKALRRANRLMELGEHSQAAGLFERIAFGARDLGMTRRAPFLFFQGARAHLLAGNTTAGSEMLWEGLSLLADEGRLEQLRRASARIVDELRMVGQDELAGEVSSWLTKTLAQEGTEADHEPAGREAVDRGRLPVICQNCGSALHLDDVEWIDSSSVACSYCGGVVRAVS